MLGCHEFEHARSPFSEALEEPHFRFHTIELLPQGINNSAFPRRKMFLRAEILDQPAAEKESIQLSADALNTDLKTQAVSRDVAQPVEVKPEDLKSLYTSVRKLYEQEILSRDSTGKKRSPAFSIPFTPDITIWCSKHYPKHNHGRPRLEAYFCEVTPEGKAERGFADRGSVLVQTKKRIVKLLDSEVMGWLNMTYPFSYVRERRSEKKQELTEYFYSIRDNAIEYYTKVLSGENLAIKTLWYLYPNLQDMFSEREYIMLNTMVTLTEIGWLRVQDTIPDFLCDEIQDYFKQFYSLPEDARVFPLSKHQLTRGMEYGCKQSGVKKIRIHDLRHSHVSLLINMGYSAVAIGNRVGHESVDITFRYAHMFPTVQKEMATKLNEERSA